MNIVIYGVLWVAIGLLAGLIANWITEAETWPWFWVDLLTGAAGAVLSGYFVTSALFGLAVTLSVYSFLFALFGATLLLAIGALLRRVL